MKQHAYEAKFNVLQIILTLNQIYIKMSHDR